jgi:hypothetical protein
MTPTLKCQLGYVYVLSTVCQQHNAAIKKIYLRSRSCVSCSLRFEKLSSAVCSLVSAGAASSVSGLSPKEIRILFVSSKLIDSAIGEDGGLAEFELPPLKRIRG